MRELSIAQETEKQNSRAVIFKNSKKESEEENGEYVFKLVINNINGNSNEVEFTPSDISVSRGSLGDLDEESTRKIVKMLTDVSKEGEYIKINIPIFILNINNILSNGNKNNVSVWEVFLHILKRKEG